MSRLVGSVALTLVLVATALSGTATAGAAAVGEIAVANSAKAATADVSGVIAPVPVSRAEYEYTYPRYNSLVGGPAGWTSNTASPSRLHFYTAADEQLHLATVLKNKLVVHRVNPKTFATRKIKSVKLNKQFPIFGTFYAAEDGHFYVARGRENRRQKRHRNVIEVTKYNPDWRQVARTHIPANAVSRRIQVPFYAGAADMTQIDNTLVLHSGRLMFTSSDGLNHQASFTARIDTETMEAKNFSGSRYRGPYTSHSFNQLVTSQGADLYFVDHGDAYPRGIRLHKYADFDKPDRQEQRRAQVPMRFMGKTGDNRTDAMITGLAAGEGNALIVGAAKPHRQPVKGVRGWARNAPWNIFLISTDGTKINKNFRWLTTAKRGKNWEVSEPRIVALDSDRFVVLYGTRNLRRPVKSPALHYRLVDSTGQVLASRTWRAAAGLTAPFNPLSKPIVVGDQVVWAGEAVVKQEPEVFIQGLDLADVTKPHLRGVTQVRAVGKLRVKGAVRVGKKLRATAPRWSVAGAKTRYIWRVGGIKRKAKGATYRIKPRDRGKRIRVIVRGQKKHYVPTRSSVLTGKVRR